MNPKNEKLFKARVVSAAYHASKAKGYVTAVDVFLGMGVLSKEHYEDWRFRRVPCLEQVIQMNLKKISLAMKIFRVWATEQGLYPSRTAYHGWGKKNHGFNLRFCKSGEWKIEEAYRTHYVDPKQKSLCCTSS